MEFFTIVYTMFETVIILFFVLTLFGYKTNILINNIFFFLLLLLPIELLLSIIQSPSDIKMLASLLSYVILLRISVLNQLSEAIMISLFSNLLLLIFDNTIQSLYIGTSKVSDYSSIFSSISFSAIYWISLLLIALITLYIHRKNITIPQFLLYVNDQKYRLLFIVTGLLLFQTLITAQAHRDENSGLFFYFELISSLAIVVLIIIFVRFMKFQKPYMSNDTEDSYLENVESLLLTVRSQRHDYLNHLQVIHTLSKLNRVDEIKNYLDEIIQDVKEISSFLEVYHPAFSALLRAKESIALSNQIKFEVKVLSTLKSMAIRPFELVKVVGNIIDNAFEEESQAPVIKRNVRVTIDRKDDTNEIEIFNSNSFIDPHSMGKIFEPGYTTKENHSGIGLAVSKKILETYKGNLEIESDKNQGTTFRIVIPTV